MVLPRHDPIDHKSHTVDLPSWWTRRDGIGRGECSQISICLFWPHAVCTRDLAYSVQHATPYPWCICVESRDFSLTRSRTHEFWTYRDESFMGVVSSRRRRRRRRSGKLRVFSRMACRNLQCVVRMLWHLHEPIFSYVNVSNLGAAHMILSAFYRLRHERLCVARWQVADLLRQERESDGASLVWYVCLSPRHARAHQGHDIIATVALEVAGCESLRGRTGSLFICSYLNILVWMCSCLHAPTLICPCGIYQSGTSISQSPDGMLRICFGETRIRWPFACLVCVSVTTTRPCTQRTRHHCGH